MSLSKYILKGKIAAGALSAEKGSGFELLVWFDADAQESPTESLATVKRHYQKEVCTPGAHLQWEKPVLALPAPEVKPRQLLFSLPGIQVYDLSAKDEEPAAG